MAQTRLFNPLKRKVLRRQISVHETWFAVVFLLLLATIAIAIALQKDRFDPSARDISFAQLATDSVEDTLYHPPLKRWVAPGTGAAAQSSIDLGIFPSEVLAGGWRPDGRVETYDPSNLYEKINGAAEQYLSFGFRRLDYLTLVKDRYFVTIEVYDQGEFGNALGIFSAQRDASRSVVTRPDGVYYYSTSVGAIGGYENYYFKIAGNSTAEEVTSKAAALVEALAGLPVQTSTSPWAFTVLTRRLGVPFDRIAYQKNDVFRYDFARDFWFGSMRGDSEARFFLHQASDEGQAQALFDQLLEEQAFEYEVVEADDRNALLEHRFLHTFFSLHRRGPLVFGVDGADDPGQARAGRDRLEKAVSGDD
ncbi:MAG: DUF6599 family protein [Thermoanaerobaculales bacterium]